MKKLLAIAVAASVAGIASAAYVSPLWEVTASPWGDVANGASWGGSVPFGSTTGLLSSATLSSWDGDDAWKDISLRIEGTGIATTVGSAGTPTTVPAVGGINLRGGTVPGLTTLVEIAGSNGALNLNAGTLTLWSQNGGNSVLSIFSGGVEAEELRLISSGGTRTINLLDGQLHATLGTTASAQFNMLTGGTGNITIDAVENQVYDLNFETGSLADFTLGSKFGGTAGGVWEFAIANGFIKIDGVADTDLANFSITSTGGNDTTISLIPEPATLSMIAMLGGGILWIRKRFMV
jgi:hypothetical protein